MKNGIKMTLKERKYLNTKEAAELLGTPLVTVLRWAHQGKIPARSKNEVYSFKRTEIIEWARSHDIPLPGDRTAAPVKPAPDNLGLKHAIERGGVIERLEGGDIYSVLEHAVELANLPPGTDKELVLNELINREEIASTGIGKGVAIPHPRRALNLQLEHPVIPVAFLERPVDFNAVDGEEIFVLFLMFSPSTKVHLKLLSRLSYCLRRKSFIALLKERPGMERLLLAVEEIEGVFDTEHSPAVR